ncbi:hypothetical protein KB559_20110 [Paenibacillus sp. Marseille-P2973]|uniref:hypothetical protein n=1 Tax=Paenibacillus sp. Marseille-P2973 TaxID=1871032 RepID=UPI001B378E58|nr:hypothetical protein [Paenibacillus sp. Marseille-P2973]MBQ4901151.1 hypothetical protein [Paenibacillus sp. Marseille-P2973]
MKNLFIQLEHFLRVIQASGNNVTTEYLEAKNNCLGEYNEKCKQLGKDKVIKEIQNSFAGDYSSQLFLLSVLIKELHDFDVLLYLLDILCTEEISLGELKHYKTQVITMLNNKVTTHLEKDIYFKQRQLNSKINKLWRDELGIELPYVPLKDRNSNRIVIVTNQLIDEDHAPTRILLELIYILQEVYNMQVYTIVAFEQNYDYGSCISPIFQNRTQQLDRFFELDCGFSKMIAGYQIVINENNNNEQRELVEAIYDYNPMCIWKLGSIENFADLFNGVFTVMSMNLTKQLVVSESDILLRYLKGDKKSTYEIERFIEEKKQTIIDFRIPYVPEDNGKEIATYDSLPEGAFPIVIAGNRLRSELNNIVVEMLETILEISDSIYFIFIGQVSLDQVTTSKKLISRSRYMGYSNNFYRAVGEGKLFLNLPRSGAAAGAVCSIFQGIPVVTLPNCDVASAVGEEFECETLEDMVNQVKRYVTDSEFYQHKHNAALKKAEEEKQINLVDQVGRILLEAKQLIEKKEIV